MIKKGIITIFSLFIVGFSNGQNPVNIFDKENQRIDTLYVMNLKNDIYDKKKIQILRIGTVDKEKKEYRKAFRIFIGRETAATIALPMTSLEFTDFSKGSLEETEKGFRLRMIYYTGKGWLHRLRDFFFTYRDAKFYLETIKIENSTSDRDFTEKKTMKIEPPLSIEKFVIADYLKE